MTEPDAASAQQRVNDQLQELARVVSDVARDNPSTKWRVWGTDQVVKEFDTKANAVEYVLGSRLMLLVTGPN